MTKWNQHKSLYIIGNGFDLHHRITSDYNNFKELVKEKDRELYELIRKYIPLFAERESDWLKFKNAFGDHAKNWQNTKEALGAYEEDWASLEEALGEFDADLLLDESSTFLVSYGEEDWSDANNHDYQYEIDKVAYALSYTLKSLFTQWVLQLIIPKPYEMAGRKLNLSKDGFYLNFNYTPTLNSVYSIPEQNILYIHNKAIDENSELILGHSWESSSKETLNRAEIDSDDIDPRIVEGNEIIDQYFKDTFKHSKDIIAINKNFFQSLHTIENIYVMGHSMSQVDDEYFREITNSIDLSKVKWKVSWYKQEEKKTKFQKLTGLGVRDDLIEIIRLEEFSGSQLPFTGLDF